MLLRAGISGALPTKRLPPTHWTGQDLDTAQDTDAISYIDIGLLLSHWSDACPDNDNIKYIVHAAPDIICNGRLDQNQQLKLGGLPKIRWGSLGVSAERPCGKISISVSKSCEFTYKFHAKKSTCRRPDLVKLGKYDHFGPTMCNKGVFFEIRSPSTSNWISTKTTSIL